MSLSHVNTHALVGVLRGWRLVAGRLYATGFCPSAVVALLPWQAAVEVELLSYRQADRRERVQQARKDEFTQPAKETFCLHEPVKYNSVATNLRNFM